MGITGHLLNCLASFLTNRSQNVKVENQFSNTRFLRSGVPQGSVLGPILFIVYINGVTDMLPNCAISKIFADDLKSYIPITSEADLLNYKRLLYGLSMWSTMWQLPMAPKKCQWMFIANKSCSIQSENDFKIQGTVLEEVNFQTDLGIRFTSSLCFKEHINIICNKAKSVIFLINKRFITKDPHLLLLAYKSYVLPILTYCSPIWSPYKIGEIQTLEKVQKAFTKKLKGYEMLPYGERLRMGGLKSLELLRIYADLILCYKILHNLVALDKEKMFVFENYDGTRGHGLKLRAVRPHTEFGRHSYGYRTVALWNQLSPNTVWAPTIGTFKYFLKQECFSEFLTQKYDIPN